MSQARLFVGNLSYQTGETDLQDYFAQAGSVLSVNLMLDKMTGRSRGFAFVEYASEADAQKAIEQFHDKDFQGRKITVNVARPREERAPGGGGGRFDGPRRDSRDDRRGGGGGGGGGRGGAGGGGRRDFRR